jgi:glycine dehydrogenase subunit 1
MEYIPHTEKEQQDMLRFIGVASFDELLEEIPSEVRLKRPLSLGAPLTEMELRREIGAMSRQNVQTEDMVCFLGAGAYDHYIPAAVPQIASRSEYYTAYTPYQAEMSQGLLQTIYEYQTLIGEITGMEVSNASLYDGASAAAEAALMAARITKRKTILLSAGINPRYRAVVHAYMGGLQNIIVDVPCLDGTTDLSFLESHLNDDVAVVLTQSPNFFGCIEDVGRISDLAHGRGALSAVSADPISLGILEAPGNLGADIVVGEGQVLGNDLNFGGPYLGFLAGKLAHVRQIPGRIVGATVDTQGRRGYCLTFQTREQHIKRDRATSNICTNQALIALMSTIYLCLMGRSGLKEAANQCLQKAHYLRREIGKIPGFAPVFPQSTFKEFVVRTPVSPSVILEGLLKRNILGGYDIGRDYPEWDRHLLVCVTEKRTREEMDHLIGVLREFAS